MSPPTDHPSPSEKDSTTASQPPEPGRAKLGTFASIRAALSSWRTASVVLLSFSSGMPLGLVWIAIPDWLRSQGTDIRIVGLFTLAQTPWTFNVVWAPLMDRFRLPWLGRRRGWAALAQIGLCLGILGLAGVGDIAEAPWVAFALTLAIAFAAASQDIAVDAYAVDVLEPHEQGVAAGARIALYRAGMFIAGGLAITLADSFSWPIVCVGIATLFLPMLLITAKAPEPVLHYAPPLTVRQAVGEPFVGFLSRHRAVEILVFVLLFKFGDNFAQSLLRPFLIDMGYSAVDRGVALATIGLWATIGGAILGGAATNVLGLGRALWTFGLLQIVSNVGYVLLANIETNRIALYLAMGFENLTQGLGTGAFSVLLLRMTHKRFSATQYALFSTLFGVGRIFSGPLAGFTVDAVGWSTFFWITMPLGLPGLFMLYRFCPWGVREPEFVVRRQQALEPLSREQLWRRGIGGTLAGFSGGVLVVSFLAALRALNSDETFSITAHVSGLLLPQDMRSVISLLSLLTFAAIIGMMTAAVAAARRGAGSNLEPPTSVTEPET